MLASLLSYFCWGSLAEHSISLCKLTAQHFWRGIFVVFLNFFSIWTLNKVMLIAKLLLLVPVLVLPADRCFCYCCRHLVVVLKLTKRVGRETQPRRRKHERCKENKKRGPPTIDNINNIGDEQSGRQHGVCLINQSMWWMAANQRWVQFLSRL